MADWATSLCFELDMRCSSELTMYGGLSTVTILCKYNGLDTHVQHSTSNTANDSSAPAHFCKHQ